MDLEQKEAEMTHRDYDPYRNVSGDPYAAGRIRPHEMRAASGAGRWAAIVLVALFVGVMLLAVFAGGTPDATTTAPAPVAEQPAAPAQVPVD
jgi:hypothetical protein